MRHWNLWLGAFPPDGRQASPWPVPDAFGLRDTNGVQDTHKTSDREVRYRWLPWYGQQVHVQLEARRRGGVVLRCVQGELNGETLPTAREVEIENRIADFVFEEYRRQGDTFEPNYLIAGSFAGDGWAPSRSGRQLRHCVVYIGAQDRTLQATIVSTANRLW